MQVYLSFCQINHTLFTSNPFALRLLEKLEASVGLVVVEVLKRENLNYELTMQRVL